jgi:hypothetical protein
MKYSLISGALILLIVVFSVLVPRGFKYNSAEVASAMSAFNPRVYTLDETDSPDHSIDDLWWLSSGGRVSFEEGGIIKTISGALSDHDMWSMLYNSKNAADTDGGSHPQNVFRLMTKSPWYNSMERVNVTIDKYYLSPSENRNGNNGIFLLSRYQDEKNWYGAGMTVDGRAVILKHHNDELAVLGEEKVYGGNYIKESHPILLPRGKRLGLKSEIRTLDDSTVSFKLSIDPGSGTFIQILDVVDDGLSHGPAILNRGNSGIKTDFMDATFQDFFIVEN